MNSDVLLVGSGPMAVEYARVLRALGVTPLTVGRGEASLAQFQAETGLPAHAGGIDSWLAGNAGALPHRAIVAVGEKWVGAVASSLIGRGIKSLLVEKPGGFDAADIRSVHLKAKQAGASLFVGYNRRFYASVSEAKRIIAEDGGVTSFNFEFTEWSHVISSIEKEDGVKEQWLLSNSTHVIDLAFHLGGEPVQLAAFTAGGLPWHPAASIFSGAGKTVSGSLFSYQANWESPGRWVLEILTRRHRLIFKPLEKLQIQKIGSVAVEPVEIDDADDKNFKPGLYKQTKEFLSGESVLLPDSSEQVKMLDWYLKIRGQAD
jgi:predicted dehydrogenase